MSDDKDYIDGGVFEGAPYGGKPEEQQENEPNESYRLFLMFLSKPAMKLMDVVNAEKKRAEKNKDTDLADPFVPQNTIYKFSSLYDWNERKYLWEKGRLAEKQNELEYGGKGDARSEYFEKFFVKDLKLAIRVQDMVMGELDKIENAMSMASAEKSSVIYRLMKTIELVRPITKDLVSQHVMKELADKIEQN